MARTRHSTRVAWHRVYLALAAVSTLVLALQTADVPPFGDLPPIGAAALIVGLFAAASVGHWYDVRRARRRDRERPPDVPGTLGEEIRYREENDGASADSEAENDGEADDGEADHDRERRGE